MLYSILMYYIHILSFTFLPTHFRDLSFIQIWTMQIAKNFDIRIFLMILTNYYSFHCSFYSQGSPADPYVKLRINWIPPSPRPMSPNIVVKFVLNLSWLRYQLWALLIWVSMKNYILVIAPLLKSSFNLDFYSVKISEKSKTVPIKPLSDQVSKIYVFFKVNC